MKREVKTIIESRPITNEDLEAYPGYAYKSDDSCIFEQNKYTDHDIFGHDSYESYCTRSGKPKSCDQFICSRCHYKTTVKEYKEELNASKDITKLVQSTKFSNLICTSFEEAKHNDKKRNIVIIDNSDIYLTYKLNGVFGEFVCWVEDEFKEDFTVYHAMIEWIKDIYSRSDEEIENRLKDKSFPFDFTPYDDMTSTLKQVETGPVLLIRTTDLTNISNIKGRIHVTKHKTYDEAYEIMKNTVLSLVDEKYKAAVEAGVELTDAYLGKEEARVNTNCNWYWRIINPKTME